MIGLSITDVAATRVHNYIASRGKGAGLRVGVKTNGCSGMAYVIEFVDDIEDSDHVFVSNGITIVVDPKSIVYIDGTELDYAKEGLNEGFKFNNPLEKNLCGCGESFNV